MDENDSLFSAFWLERSRLKFLRLTSQLPSLECFGNNVVYFVTVHSFSKSGDYDENDLMKLFYIQICHSIMLANFSHINSFDCQFLFAHGMAHAITVDSLGF